MRRLILTAGLLVCSLTVGAQEADAPTLTDVQALTLSVYDLQVENLRLRLLLVERERAIFLASLARPGYQLARQSDGTWRYVETPK